MWVKTPFKSFIHRALRFLTGQSSWLHVFQKVRLTVWQRVTPTFYKIRFYHKAWFSCAADLSGTWPPTRPGTTAANLSPTPNLSQALTTGLPSKLSWVQLPDNLFQLFQLCFFKVRAKPFSARTVKKKHFLDVDIVVKNKSMFSLAWPALWSTTIRVITVVKMSWTREAAPFTTNGLVVRLDFRRSLVSCLPSHPSPRRTYFQGKERGLLSRTAAGNGAYLMVQNPPCWRTKECDSLLKRATSTDHILYPRRRLACTPAWRILCHVLK